MDTQKRSAEFGAALLIFAVLLRLLQGSLYLPGFALREVEASQNMVRWHGGAISATIPATIPTQPPETMPNLPPETTAPIPILPTKLQFSAADMGYVMLQTASDCGYYPDLMPLLLQPLDWLLQVDAPTVLILHSHACEAYTRQEGEVYTELANCRTTEEAYNMVAVGDALARMLCERGIGVIHDRQLHDGESYNSAYTNSRNSVADYLEAYPSIRLVLDLHRDAASQADGGRYATKVTVDGQAGVQFMLVVGTDYRSGTHTGWQENLALALKLQVLLEQRVPGITRPTVLRGSHFNQDLSAGALLIEVGASGNTRQEVARSLPILADAIAALAGGAEGM